MAAIFCCKRPRRQPNCNGSSKNAKRIAIANDFPSQGKIARVPGGGHTFGFQKTAAVYQGATENRNHNRRKIATLGALST